MVPDPSPQQLPSPTSPAPTPATTPTPTLPPTFIIRLPPPAPHHKMLRQSRKPCRHPRTLQSEEGGVAAPQLTMIASNQPWRSTRPHSRKKTPLLVPRSACGGNVVLPLLPRLMLITRPLLRSINRSRICARTHHHNQPQIYHHSAQMASSHLVPLLQTSPTHLPLPRHKTPHLQQFALPPPISLAPSPASTV